MFHRFRNTLRKPLVDLRSTPSGAIERWLGHYQANKISHDMRGWYGPPIAVAGVPGAVFATGDGDFIGRIDGGAEASQFDKAIDYYKRVMRNAQARRAMCTRQFGGLGSLSEATSVASGVSGQRYEYQYQKVGSLGVAGVTSSLWRVGSQPAGGGAPAGAPGGRAPVDSTQGGHPFTNPASGTQHIASANSQASVANNTLLLYDRIFDITKNMTVTTAEAVTGVPTRWQNQTGGSSDYIGGNFLFPEVGGTALSAVAHNWTVMQYTNQDGAGATLPSLTGVASAIVDRVDMGANQWFAPLAAGDVGVKNLTQMQYSAVATGVVNWVMGHPLAWMGFFTTVMTPFNFISDICLLPRVIDDACLALLEVNKPSTTATTYNVNFMGLAK